MARLTKKAEPQKRDGLWYLVRRVPAEYRAVDQRLIIDSAQAFGWPMTRAA